MFFGARWKRGLRMHGGLLGLWGRRDVGGQWWGGEVSVRIAGWESGGELLRGGGRFAVLLGEQGWHRWRLILL